jgi:hypothetical protein
MLGDGDGQPDMIVEIPVRPVAVQVGQRRVVRAGARHHHVVDRGRQVGEEPVEGVRVGGVERRGAARAEFGRGPLQAVGVAGSQDDVGPFGAGLAGGLEPDARASADHDDGLPGQFRSALGERGI